MSELRIIIRSNSNTQVTYVSMGKPLKELAKRRAPFDAESRQAIRFPPGRTMSLSLQQMNYDKDVGSYSCPDPKDKG